MKCSDVSVAPILKFLLPFHKSEWAFAYPIHGGDFDHRSVCNAFPEGCPHKIVLAKMRKLIRKGWVSGCACGCRGDFYLTDAGREHYSRLLYQKLVVQKISSENPFLSLLNATRFEHL